MVFSFWISILVLQLTCVELVNEIPWPTVTAKRLIGQVNLPLLPSKQKLFHLV